MCQFGDVLRLLDCNVELIVLQGCKDFYCINYGSDYPLEAAKDYSDMYRNSVERTFCVVLIPYPQGLP